MYSVNLTIACVILKLQKFPRVVWSDVFAIFAHQLQEIILNERAFVISVVWQEFSLIYYAVEDIYSNSILLLNMILC